MVKQARSIVDALLTKTFGRRQLARLGRHISNVARFDVPNDIQSNGEHLVQQALIKSQPIGSPLVAFDIGANRGLWTSSLLSFCTEIPNITVSVYVFEPVESTMKMLLDNLDGAIRIGTVLPVRAGMSDQEGHSMISVFGPGCGTNALCPDPQKTEAPTEEVFLWTIDSYCEKHGIRTLSFAKIDTEGHDLFVIRGAKKMLDRQAIGLVQFEYNHRWIWSRVYLRDAFDVANASSYAIGKITPVGIEFYDHWCPELETFVEGNYLMCRPDLMKHFPWVKWWNS